MLAPISTAYGREHLDRRIELGRTRPSARCWSSSTAARSEAGPSSTPPLTLEEQSTPDAQSPVRETGTNGFIPSVHPLLTPQLLLQSDTTTDLPSPQDLDALQPRRFTIPSHTSPESYRVVYSRAWAQTYEALSHAFTKSQLLHLAGPLGLSLDPLGEASKMRARTRGKKYLNKTLGMMNKKELCVTIMVLKWGMVDPAAVPAAAKGPKATQAIPLSDRTLFLLLSPSSTTFSHLSANHSLRFSFQQDPQTSTLNLIVSGPEASVLVAQETIGSIGETADRRDFVLPDSTRSLPAEVYQTISRNAKVYLEAPEDAKESDSVLRATTNDKKGLETAERLLGLAFAEARKARATNLIVRNAEGDKDEFCFVPFGPISSPAFPNDSTSSFARLVDVNRRSRDGGEEIKTTGSSDVLSRINNMRSLLPNSAESTTKHGVKATFGHLLFPLYPSSSTPVFGPVALDDVTSLPPHRHFLSCPPTGFLSSTGATKSTRASGLSNPSKNVYDLPFFSDLSDEEDADDPLDRLNQLALDSPDLSSEAFRRIRYVRKPRALQPSDSLEQILEVVYLPHQDLLTRTHVRSTHTNVLYPSHSSDLALSASHQELLATTALTGFEKGYLPSRTPLELEYAGEDWLLSSDRQVRRTQVGELRIERWVEITSRGDEGAQMGVEVEWVMEDGKYGVEEWFTRVERRVMLKAKEH
ncbi:BZ3500_MvSof-1268-A1-R1_Chr7-3g09670 [Microbotryum saponariae]|uniref:BZ3500_MvSof-1268-A1-R1_Chr7-3g09670 protein n=1 Tax=Microbotryum saponariae TaxID=289078 RepID=A0A2X0LP63_9BASI|nr:BZ3501_MvSof-1269-A2-R1_Chr7-2g09393 [Microbotryum saponariae]SDA02383.1 BZ3500_MvSof-1268-A1-R1_Chr7-3g09670 [Microbotryum saponariae]